MEILPETKRRISETVMEILRIVDMDQTTEYQVRTMAAERLGTDLSSSEHWRLVRDVVESFLLSTEETANELSEPALPNVAEETKEVVREEQEANPSEADCEREIIVCKLAKNKHVVIQDSNGSKMVSIREYYLQCGKLTPKSKNNKGLSLTTEQWSAFRKNVPAIQEAITKMESRIRSNSAGNQNENVPSSVANPTAQGLVPLKSVRLDEKNYYFWTQYMESFLNQLKIAYVLKDPCPIIAPTPGARIEEISPANAAVRKWVDDDYICHHYILNSLSDHLYDEYSKKTRSARELWEELKLFCLSEYGMKRSLVKKYIEFQVVEGKSIPEQVQELNKMADSIAAAGMLINETFHVSVIISKLPPSWKDCRMRLIYEEHLSLWMMMDCLWMEEESRTKEKRGEPSSNAHVGGSDLDMDLGRDGTKEMRDEPSDNALGGSHLVLNHGRDKSSGPKIRFPPKCTPRERWERWGRRLRQSQWH